MMLPYGYEKGYVIESGPSLTFLYQDGEVVERIRSSGNINYLVSDWVGAPWVYAETIYEENYILYKLIRRV